MPRRKKPVEEPPLVPMPDFEDAVRRLLNTPKQEIEEKLADFQASNKARREAKKVKSC